MCCQFVGDYWLRHIRPDLTEEFSKGIDKGILKLFETTTIRINTVDWSDHVTERMKLPLRMKGCGFRDREAEDRWYGQFLGAMLQIILPLMDRMNSGNCHIPDRLNIPAITNLLGEDLFNHPCTAHWEVPFTRNPSDNLAIGAKHACSHLKTTF